MTPNPFFTKLRVLILFLASGRLAVMLLPVIVAIMAGYLFIPQVGQGDPALVESWVEQKGLLGWLFHRLWLTNIKESWLFFYFPYTLLFVNLVFGMIKRFPVLIRMCRFPKRTPRAPAPLLEVELEGAGLDAADIANLLRRRGYRLLSEEGRVYGLRGRFSLVGSWVFHVSLLILMVTGFFLMGAQKTFRGTLAVGEGERFDLHSTPFLSAKVRPPKDLPPLQFQVEAIEFVAEDIDLLRFESTLLTPEGKRTVVGINRPYRAPPYQVMSQGFGYMPGWAVKDMRGRVVSSGWVKLVPFPLEVEDLFSLGSRVGGLVRVTFYPDYKKIGDEERSQSYEARNPKFKTRIEVQGETVFEGLLDPGQKVSMGEGRTFLFLPEIRMYTILDVIEEEDYATAFACFGGMILGLVFRYARIRKEIWVQISRKSVQIAGRSEILPALFQEELEALAGDVAMMSPRLDDGKSMESGKENRKEVESRKEEGAT
jgi:hypothetical protein